MRRKSPVCEGIHCDPGRELNNRGRFMRRLGKIDHCFQEKSNVIHRRPSVAFADYDIEDTRSSMMSSLLLLCATMEGVSSFVLPIIDAFGPPNHDEHKFYFEVFQIIQFTVSIAALAYLQGLISYYDRKTQRQKRKRENILQTLCKRDPNFSIPSIEEENDWEIEFTQPSNNETVVLKDDVQAIKKITVIPILKTEHSDDGPIAFADGLPDSEVTVLSDDSSTPNTPFTYAVIGEEESRNYRSNEQPPNAEFDKISGSSSTTVIREFQTDDAAGQNDLSPEKISKNYDDFLSQPTVNLQWHPQITTEHSLARSESLMAYRRFSRIGRMFGDEPERCLNYCPPFTRDNEGINLYLRLGAVVFGFGVMILDGFRVADRFHEENSAISCHSLLWIPKNIIHAVYIFWQTYFLFKYHRVVFNVQKFFLRFIFSHMAVVNLGQWLSLVVQEVMNTSKEASLEHDMTMGPLKYSQIVNRSLIRFDIHGNNKTLKFDDIKCHSQASSLAHYLIPCGVEYSLIACAIFYKMFQRIGHVYNRQEMKLNTNEGATRLIDPNSGFSECHRAHKGLFVGLLVFMATLVALTLFYLFYNEKKLQSAVRLYQFTDMTLLTFGIIGVIISIFRIRKLSLRELSEEDAFDDNLLLVGLLGMLLYDMFLLIPAIEATGGTESVAELFVVKAVLEMVQALAQVFLILEASRRASTRPEHVLEKPGRAIITFLLILNLAMWIVNTFELKHAENHSIHSTYYTGIAWKIITHLSLPLLIFFRFHSTVCLADIWTNAYQIRAR